MKKQGMVTFWVLSFVSPEEVNKGRKVIYEREIHTKCKLKNLDVTTGLFLSAKEVGYQFVILKNKNISVKCNSAESITNSPAH